MPVVRSHLFVVAVKRFLRTNPDKIVALHGILNTNMCGIKRKVAVIADILGIEPGDVPVVRARRSSLQSAKTISTIRVHMRMVSFSDWRLATPMAEKIQRCRFKLRMRGELDPMYLTSEIKFSKESLARWKENAAKIRESLGDPRDTWMELENALSEMDKING